MNDIIEARPVMLLGDEPVERPQARALTASGTTPADLLRMAVEQGADLDRLERFMALKTQWDELEAKKACIQAMTAFKAEPLTIFKRKEVGYKTKEGDFVGYKHAELSDVIAVVCPAMSKHGLSHRWNVTQTAGSITVECIVRHALGHSESVTMSAPPDTSGKKNAIQQIASTVQYLQRYTLLAVTGTSTKGEDNDGADGGDAGDDVSADAYLQAFRDASLEGTEALRKHYTKSAPNDAWWAKNAKALKQAAAQADAKVAS